MANVPKILPVAGALDTAHPESNRPMGTLVGAQNCNHRSMGPRWGRSRAATIQGSVWRSVYEADGVDDYILWRYVKEQMTLGLEWTLDVLIEPTAVGTSEGAIFTLGNSTHMDIHLYLDGSGAAGADPRTIVCTVRASNTSGASGSAVTVRDTTQRTLSTPGTPAQDPALVYHVRVTRNGAALSMKVNGVETTGTGLSTTVGHAYAGDGIYMYAQPTLANSYYGGWIYKALLRQGVFTDLSDGWLDIAHTKVPHVLFSSSGGNAQLWVGSGSYGQETSRFRNYGSVVGSPNLDSLTSSPGQFPVQAIGTNTDQYGRTWNYVMVNGYISYERAT